MHLLAESGGTKTQWFFYDHKGCQQVLKTSGMNPNALSVHEIEAQQRREWGALLPESEALTLHFYGAGLGAASTEQALRGLLERLFPAAKIAIDTDMRAAALATAGDAEGLVCILGTGSNCCRWDGQAMVENHGSHGYLFNDEGSGADLGRHLLSALLSNELPAAILERFTEWTGKSMLELRTEVYQAAKINVALSEYSPFLSANLHEPALRELVRARFEAFLLRHVKRTARHQALPIHFVGSVAAHYAELLQETLADHQLRLGRIIGAPGESLLAYHVQKLNAAKP